MTKFLQDLLTSTEPLFPQALSQLERSTGSDGVDVRLIADVTHKAHDVMRGLKLDTADTTARELYLALNSYITQSTTHELLFDADFMLLKIENEVVSFNLIDVIENVHHQLPFDQRMITHGQRALRGEIIARYIAHPRTDEGTTRQFALDAGLVEPSDQHYPSVKAHQAALETSVATGPYILTIGDIFTDAFIKLDEKYARIDTDSDGSKRLSLPFGSKPPYDSVDIVKAVGPSPNAAVASARLGLRTGLMAWLGDDLPGEESLEHLASERVDTSLMITQPNSKSSYWYVLRYGSDRTMLVRSEAYDYEWQAPENAPDWIYLSYIGANSWPLHEGLLGYLNDHPETKLVFQPGTFHFEWGIEKLAALYQRSHLVVMNREEAVEVTGKTYDSLHDLATGLHDLGVTTVVITDGSNGSYASFDGKLVTIPNYPDPAPPLDRTGAGDAFASTIMAALAQGESVETALTWAPINSMSVVQKLGAQAGLLSKEDIQKYLDGAPDWYKVSELTK
ncbi:MAG: putative Ribokinase [Candidatus Saccharibacteria bacterium]|nr:putative Ribokinase [Candidatus Saccharibacteria bacterium]